MTNRRQPRYSKGQRIANRFRVHEALMGGMGEVYLCQDEQQMLPYALKTFQGSSPALADIFRKEVTSWIALKKHPNIVCCFRMEKLDNIPFMVRFRPSRALGQAKIEETFHPLLGDVRKLL